MSSSRSQSPYRSDRSTASSTETVLVATPLNHHSSSHRNSRRRENRVEMTHEKPYAVHIDVEKNNRYESTENKQRTVYESVNKGKPLKEDLTTTSLRNGLPSKLLRTHDSTNQQVRLSWHGPEDVKQSVPNQSRTRERVNGFELLLVNDSANQNARLSWHGTDREDRLSSQEHFAHDAFKNNSRSPTRRSQISWADQRNFGFNGQRVNQRPRDDYQIATVNTMLINNC